MEPERHFSERRQHARTRVSHPAMLQLEGSFGAVCEIRDFSALGMFIGMPGGLNEARRYESRLGSPVVVSFMEESAGQRSRLRLEGVVARAAESGIGVAFAKEVPRYAMKALKDIARHSDAIAQSRAVRAEAHGSMAAQMNSTEKNYSRSERRRQPRYAVFQTATVKVGDLPEARCEIRDYCRDGLYLRLRASSTAALRRFANCQGARVSVSFSPDGKADEALTLNGTVARVADFGLGVACTPPVSPNALKILEDNARRMAGKLSAGGPDPKIAKACRELLMRFLPDVEIEFAARVRDALMVASDHAESGRAQMEFFDARSVFELPTVHQRFHDAVMEQADSYELIHEPEQQPADSSRLSLVDSYSFEDWLNLQFEMDKLQDVFQGQLGVLERRLSEVAPVPVSAHNNPYGPLALGAAFGKAIKDQPVSNAAKKVAYQALAQSLGVLLPRLYSELEQITAPIIVPTLVKGGDAADATPAATARDEAEVAKAQAEASSVADPASAAAQAEIPRGIPAVASPSIGQPVPARVGASAPMAAPMPAPGMPAPGANLAPSTTLSETFGGLIDLLNRRATAQKGRAGELDGWAKNLASVSEVFRGRLNPAQVHSVQFTGSILGQLRSDPLVSDTLKPYLQQWQLPLFKQSIRDPAILNQQEHPVHRLLDLFDTLSLAMDEAGPGKERIKKKLDHWTERFIKEGDRDPSLIERALGDLEQTALPLRRQRDQRFDRLRQGLEGQQRSEEAQRAVAEEIAKRPLSGQVPRIVHELIENGWRQLLVLIHLRPGPDSETWHEAWNVIDRLLDWTTAGSQPHAQDARELIDQVDEQLGPVCPDLATRIRISDDLNAILIGVGQPPIRRPVDFVHVEPPERPLQGKLLEPVGLEQVRDFRGNEWLQIPPRPDAQPVPMRLAWVIGDHERFVFTDQRGKKTLELSAHEFARHLRNGSATRRPDLDLPPVARAVTKSLEIGQQHLLHDPLTGLLTRKAFLNRLRLELSAPERREVPRMVAVVEIDQVRLIGRVCGGDASDELLFKIAGLVKSTLARGEFAARLGDSHLGVLLTDCTGELGKEKALAIRNAVRGFRFDWDKRSFALDAKIGMAWLRAETVDPESVLKDADLACVRAAELGAGEVQVFEEGDTSLSTAQRVLDWAGRIGYMLVGDNLFARCQKIAPVADPHGAGSHYEILLGVRDDDGKIIPPAEFIMAAERWQLMVDVDRWQVETVFKWIERNPKRFAQIGGFSINLSGQTLVSEPFLTDLQVKLAQADWAVEKITFEITETAAIAQLGQAEKFIRQIKRFGCKFSLDDFGSGLASYAYLKHLRVDYLKIDGVFVKDLASSETDFAMVKSMNEIARLFSMKTIAEYVESLEILNKLAEIGVDYAQGYHLGKPLPLNDL